RDRRSVPDLRRTRRPGRAGRAPAAIWTRPRSTCRPQPADAGPHPILQRRSPPHRPSPIARQRQRQPGPIDRRVGRRRHGRPLAGPLVQEPGRRDVGARAQGARWAASPSTFPSFVVTLGVLGTGTGPAAGNLVAGLAQPTAAPESLGGGWPAVEDGAQHDERGPADPFREQWFTGDEVIPAGPDGVTVSGFAQEHEV